MRQNKIHSISPSSPQIARTCVQNPTLGGAMDMELSGVPNGGIGAVLAIIGASGPGVPQPSPPFAVGCEAYIPANSPSLGIVINANPCSTYGYSIGVPNDPVWLCLPFACQGAALDVNNNQFVLSNALDAVTGNL